MAVRIVPTTRRRPRDPTNQSGDFPRHRGFRVAMRRSFHGADNGPKRGCYYPPVPVPVPAPAPGPLPVTPSPPGVGSYCDLGNTAQKTPQISTKPKIIDNSRMGMTVYQALERWPAKPVAGPLTGFGSSPPPLSPQARCLLSRNACRHAGFLKEELRSSTQSQSPSLIHKRLAVLRVRGVEHHASQDSDWLAAAAVAMGRSTLGASIIHGGGREVCFELGLLLHCESGPGALIGATGIATGRSA
jgi:hypothetical protein